MPRRDLRFLLLQARNPGDRVREEERRQFAARMKVDPRQVQTRCLLTETLDASIFDQTDMLLVGGSGEYSVTEPHPGVERAKVFLALVAQQGFPTFASCFGFQLLVEGMGGKVEPKKESAEVGTYHLELTEHGQADPVFSSLGPRFTAQLGHKDHATVLPSGVDNLARSVLCENQALRVHDKPVYAAQFHPELNWTDNRGRFERYFDHYAHAFGEVEARRMLEEDFFPSPQASALLDRFIEQTFAR